MFSYSFRINDTIIQLNAFACIHLLNSCCYSRLQEQWLDQDALVTSDFRGKSIYGCAAHKSLITILFTTHLHFISICMHSCRRILNPGLFPSIEHNPNKANQIGSINIKLNQLTKSCRCFLYTILAVLPNVRLNLGLLGETAYHTTIRNPDRLYQPFFWRCCRGSNFAIPVRLLETLLVILFLF